MSEELGEEFEAVLRPALITVSMQVQDPMGTGDLLTQPLFCPWETEPHKECKHVNSGHRAGDFAGQALSGAQLQGEASVLFPACQSLLKQTGWGYCGNGLIPGTLDQVKPAFVGEQLEDRGAPSRKGLYKYWLHN